MKEMNVPVGVSDFEKIHKNGYYYIDKSGLIRELLSNTGTKATVITRPRRFGKTLGMSMLESFFDIRKDSRKLFEGLEIAKNQAFCDEWMNQYPTVFVSFRQVDGLNFTGAYDMLTWVISELYKKHLYLLDSDKINASDKEIAKQLIWGNASLKDTKGSLMLLTRMMQQHYEKPVILLIDEYDVPVAKANSNGYYDELPDGMVALMIPNAEIKEIFETTVIKWFDDSTKKWNRNALFDAVWNGDGEGITREMNALLRRTISYHDYREDFYHAFLAGIFTGAGYMVDSNKEHGEGRSNVVVYDSINARVAIFEAKYTRTLGNLESECDMVLQQIDDRMYAKEYEDDYDQTLCYGISFFKKRCMVKKK